MKFDQKLYDHAKEQLKILKENRHDHWEEMIDIPPKLDDALFREAVDYWRDALVEQTQLKLSETPLPKE